MSVETETTGENIRLGVSIRPFSHVVGVFAVIGLTFGVAGFLIGHSEQGQLARQSLGMLMFAVIPFAGILTVSILGISVGREMGDAQTAAITLGAAALVGHLLLFMLAMPLVMAQPIDPPIPEIPMMMVWLRATVATALAGVLIGILTNKL